MDYSGLEPHEVHTTENPCNFLPLAFPARQLTLESELWLFGGHDMSR